MVSTSESPKIKNRVLQEIIDEISEEDGNRPSFPFWQNWMNWSNWQNWTNWMNWWT